MSYQQNPQLGATFYPGGVDDFYMPEVISPAPQRVMHEMPDQIQSNLAHLELESNGPRKGSAPLSPETPTGPRHDSFFPTQPHQNDRNSYQSFQGQHTGYQQPDYNGHNRSAPQQFQQKYGNESGMMGNDRGLQSPPQQNMGFSQFQQQAVESAPQSQVYKGFGQGQNAFLDHQDQPNFSPFPRLRNPPANVPPSDEEKEATLEAARVNVLNSNDPEVQLAWAQDVLAYVEVSMQNEIRSVRDQPARPQTPQVEHRLRVDSLNIVTFLAEQHHPKAEFMRGLWLEFGKFGFRTDKKEAFRCYKRAAEKGYSRAEYRIGMSWENSDEFIKARQHYGEGARLGDSASNYRLGMMTLLGQHGERQDFGRGVQLIRLSAHTADENAPQGAYVFGMLQARELPNISIPEIYLPLDLNGARVNLEKAAYLGFAKAQVKMGQAYELCQLGCDFNPALSLHYNALASRQGEAEADMAISKWFLCGYEGIFEKNEELAYTYAQRAAHDKLATAEFAMGYFNEIGMFVAVNLIEARAWYEKAAEHGNKDAFGRIEGITKDKTLSKKDHEDVAIARIKSQYGSMRGKRPDRLKKEPVPPMPSISDTPEPPSQPIRARTTPSPAVPILSEDTVTMPDPSTIPRPNSSLNPYGNIQIPARPSSAAPYPLEDVPPGQGGPRPGSAIGHNNPQLALPNPAVRPSSAFGINPHLMQEPIQAPYPNESPMGLPYSGADYRGPGGPGRPTSAMDYRRGGRGDDYPGPGRGRGRIQSGGYGPQDYRASGGLDIDNTGRGRGRGDKPRPEPEQPQGPKLDIGFSAPLDAPSGRNKLSKPTANPNKPPGPPNDHLRPDRSATTPQPLKNDRRHDDRAQSTRPSSPPTSRPPRHETAGTLGAVNKPLPPRSTQSSPQIPQQHHPATAGAPPAPKPPASPRPPGKGPKTFDEMGVPNATKDNDCVVM